MRDLMRGLNPPGNFTDPITPEEAKRRRDEPEPEPEPEPTFPHGALDQPPPGEEEDGDDTPYSYPPISMPGVVKYGLSRAQIDAELEKARKLILARMARKGHLAARMTGGAGITEHPLAIPPRLLRRK